MSIKRKNEGPSLIEQLEFIKNFLTEITIKKASDVSSDVLSRTDAEHGYGSQQYDDREAQVRRIAARFEKRKKGLGKKFIQLTGTKQRKKSGDDTGWGD